MKRLGSSRKTHRTRAHFRKVELEDLLQEVRGDLKDGSCRYAFHHLTQAAETAGYLGSERRSAGSGAGRERNELHRDLEDLYEQFEDRCVVSNSEYDMKRRR